MVVAGEEPSQKWADAEGVKYNNYEELVTLPGVEELISSDIDRLSAGLASYESIKKFVLATSLFTIESGELTPSMKVKRKVVEENYQKEIDAMYE